MYKTQMKAKSPTESWTMVGNYSSESAAIQAAMQRKAAGAIIVRVTDKKGSIVYSG